MRITRSRPAALLGALGAALLAGCAAGPAPRADPAPGAGAPDAPAPTAMASFSAEQAERGREEFAAVCSECHATGDFRGSTFQYEWRRRTAWAFFRTVSETMPEDAPGSLTDQRYVDIVAYVLSLNGFEPGDRELPPLRDALEHFVMDGAPGPSAPTPATGF